MELFPYFAARGAWDDEDQVHLGADIRNSNTFGVFVPINGIL
jgi:hypothetical protein